MELTAVQEARARRLHDERLIMICHDHDLFPEDMERMRQGGVTAKQVHICLDGRIWNNREEFMASQTASEGYLRAALAAIDYLYWQVSQAQDEIVIALTPEDIREAKARNRIALVLGAEGPRILEGRLEVLRMLHRLGLRHLQLAWAWDTEVGAAQSNRKGEGLADFGRSVVREMNRLGMMVDVSHLAYQSMWDVLDVSSTPVLNSHTGSSVINPEQPQLLPDDLIRGIAEHGGVLGIHFMSQMVKPGRHRASLDELMRQFVYVAELVGTDHVACGPDYLYLDPRLWQNQGIDEPFTFAEGVEDVSRMLNVTRGLVAYGFSDEDIGKILGGNLLRLFSEATEGADHTPRPYQPYAQGIGACTYGSTPL